MFIYNYHSFIYASSGNWNWSPAFLHPFCPSFLFSLRKWLFHSWLREKIQLTVQLPADKRSWDEVDDSPESPLQRWHWEWLLAKHLSEINEPLRKASELSGLLKLFLFSHRLSSKHYFFSKIEFISPLSLIHQLIWLLIGSSLDEYIKAPYECELNSHVGPKLNLCTTNYYSSVPLFHCLGRWNSFKIFKIWYLFNIKFFFIHRWPSLLRRAALVGAQAVKAPL